MDLGLQGKVAIITGASDGIGKAAAISLAVEGARVAIFARDQGRLDSAAEEIKSAGSGEVLALSADVTDKDAVQAAVDKVVAEWGTVHILVNNAGTSSANKFDDMTTEMLDIDFGIKVYGAIHCSQAVLPHMKKNGWGRIINTTTPGGKASGGGSQPTSLSRAAGISLTKAMSKDFAAENILVNTVCVGLIKSGQHRTRWEKGRKDNPDLTLEQFYEKSGANVPMGRVGEAREVGDTICYLASERASYITGTAINVDGGTSPVV
ncbi:MAG: SDR family oxidoreductase [Chloroflexi bacterium]|nr:SDR family oxidoreductase [Chloroflexota bacterium]